MTTATGWVSKRAQYGWETTPGTAAVADFLPIVGETELSPTSEQKEIKASGDLHPTLIVPTKENAEFSISEGTPCYRNLVPFLAQVFGFPTVIEVAPGVHEYEFRLLTKTSRVQTATIRMGDEDFAIQVRQAIANALTLGWNVESGDADMALSGFCRRIEPVTAVYDEFGGLVNPAIPTHPIRVLVSPILADGLEVSIAESFAQLDSPAAVIDNGYAVEFEVSDRYRSFKTFGSDGGYKTIATPMSADLTVQQLNDPDSREWIARYRESRTAYVKVASEGQELVPAVDATPAVREQFVLRAAIQASEQVAPMQDEDADVFSTAGRVVMGGSAGFTPTINIVSDFAPLAAWLD